MIAMCCVGEWSGEVKRQGKQAAWVRLPSIYDKASCGVATQTLVMQPLTHAGLVRATLALRGSSSLAARESLYLRRPWRPADDHWLGHGRAPRGILATCGGARSALAMTRK
jgi:hypothetical protein